MAEGGNEEDDRRRGKNRRSGDRRRDGDASQIPLEGDGRKKDRREAERRG